MAILHSVGLLKSPNLNFYHHSYKLKDFLVNCRYKHDALDQYNVIYKFKCVANANIVYVGKTNRRLSQRIKEHQKCTSPIGRHILECDMCTNCNNISDCFEIIGQSNDYLKLSIQEAIYIRKLNPVLNKQLIDEGTNIKLRI